MAENQDENVPNPDGSPQAQLKTNQEVTYFTNATSRIIAGCFSLASFGVAVLSGLASDNTASLILFRALMVMFVCYPLGWIVGMICQHVIDEHIIQHKAANPAPDSMAEFPIEVTEIKEDDDEVMVV